ncbi:PglL family O-oligosaccharyltransferase [Polaromonas sp. CG_9.11]|uniref:PglL family O-oligosaccharyltransferase n=1 Tax=Polaromonas sp. CG_9.11 TaxID=2787730 RepID=UPI0018CA2B05|nr:O-antigen ligase family protein [Polaromonas sp. CG_9.11]MBG6076767.1 O-antigen ligase [Polaromonas sp. CG_9.11]
MPSPSAISPVMSSFSLVFWAILFAFSWLLPVHFPPWSTFPADAWSAVLGSVAALILLFRSSSALNWHGLPCLAAGLIFLPWIQFFFGLLPFAGQAWISSAYLLGFLLALLIGARWELASPAQLAHGLFIAIGLAAMASVGLQLYTWLGLSESGVMGIWSLGLTGSRPYANLGQPNLLATLLVWGLMACLWAYLHKAVGKWTAICGAAFILLGIALTQSRAGFLALSVILVAVWFWRGLWPSRQLPRVASGLYLYVLMIPALLQWLNSALLLEQYEIYVRVRQQGELRLGAWRMFFQAVSERPWFGYGWTEVSSAQIAVADRFPSQNGIFQLSHNLFLDMVLWTGLPIGFFVAAILIRWLWLRFRAVRRPEEAALFLLLVAVGIHALVEFPLQYAYFLLPVGLVMGMLNVRLGAKVVATLPHWVLSGIWLAAVAVLGVTIRDYARVDIGYGLLRLEQSIVGQGRGPMGGPPDVWVLTQLREWIVMARFRVRPSMSQKELEEMAILTRSYPSLNLAYRLATAFALNGQPAEARVWLSKICNFTDEVQCLLAQRTWALESLNDPRIAFITWPAADAVERKGNANVR